MPEAIRSAAEFLMGGVDLSAVTSAQAAELAQTVTDSIVRPLITSAIQLVSFLILFALGLMVLHIVAIAFGAFNQPGSGRCVRTGQGGGDPVYPHPGAAVLLPLRHSVGYVDTCCGTGELPHRNFL